MNYYPPALPEPKIGATFTTAEQRIDNGSEVNNRQRVIDPNYIETVTVTWSMTESQYRIFEGWIYHRINEGFSRFSANWNNKAGVIRFADNIQARLSGLHWEISANVRIDYSKST